MIADVIGEVKSFAQDHASELTIGVTSVTAGAVLGAGAVALASGKKARKRKSSNKSKRKRRNSYKTKRRTQKRRTRKTPRTAGKGKDRSHKRIRYTKNGQPYIILRSGKARFLKKSSAKKSHRKKGGRY